MSSLGWHTLAATITHQLLAMGCSAACAEELATAPSAALPALSSLLVLQVPGLADNGSQHAALAARAVLTALQTHSPGLESSADQLSCLLALARSCTALQKLAASPYSGDHPEAVQQPADGQDSDTSSSVPAAAKAGAVQHLAGTAFALLADLLRQYQPAVQDPGMPSRHQPGHS